jgi:hypothetical protein
MTFRIERLVSGENAIVLRVCGRVDIECVSTIKELMEEEAGKIALDLSCNLRAQRYRTQELSRFSSWMG